MPAYLNSPSSQIEDLLHEGQELLVQVSKEPLGTKGTRITSHTTLPGRYLVYMPLVDHIGVSRRIKDEKERKRLREIIQSLKPLWGVIVRTASEGAERRKFVPIWNSFSISGITFRRRKKIHPLPL